MNEQEFMDEICNILQRDDPLPPNARLDNEREWDSLAWMMILALAERENWKRVDMSQLRAPGTVRDLYLLLAGEK